MKRIGLTQRVEIVEAYDERRDCLDQRWALLGREAGLLFLPLPNQAAPGDIINGHGPDAHADTNGLDGLILTGGNDLASMPGAQNTAPERDRFEAELVGRCMEKKLPVLGVCRGMQFLNVHLGGRLDHAERNGGSHAGVRHELRLDVQENGGLPGHDEDRREVASYHNWVIPGPCLAPGFRPLAQDAVGNVEAMRHEELPLWGIMWHPEREDPFQGGDLNLLRAIFGVGIE